jgi:EAL domain-containing protein (putative c-di-GMP-specific phosphodiesterase class I)
MLDAAVAAAGLDLGALDLEVLESVAMRDMQTAVGILRDLRERGARISIDDFGTGYSSLAWLRDLPIDTLKIDQSFVFHLHDDPANLVIASSIVALGKALGLDVVAEGVETIAQFEALRDAGCPHFQGYVFSRPVLPETVPDTIRQLASVERHRTAKK